MYQNFPPNTVTERPREVDPPVRPSEALRARLRLHFLAESVVVVSRPPPADALALDSASSAMPPPPPGLTLRGERARPDRSRAGPPTARYASVDVHRGRVRVVPRTAGARRNPPSAPPPLSAPPPPPSTDSSASTDPPSPRAARRRLRRDDAHDRPGGLARARHGEQRESAHAQRDARELAVRASGPDPRRHARPQVPDRPRLRRRDHGLAAALDERT